jgi:hypothetical protein
MPPSRYLQMTVRILLPWLSARARRGSVFLPDPRVETIEAMNLVNWVPKGTAEH